MGKEDKKQHLQRRCEACKQRYSTGGHVLARFFYPPLCAPSRMFSILSDSKLRPPYRSNIRNYLWAHRAGSGTRLSEQQNGQSRRISSKKYSFKVARGSGYSTEGPTARVKERLASLSLIIIRQRSPWTVHCAVFDVLPPPPGLVSNPDPSLFSSAGCIASPARGGKGLATLARFSCTFGMQLKLQSHDWNSIII